ncbi:MAG: fasciclin domain-containing protein, partial [Candidatus Hydrogenedentota bacterium]
SEDGPFTVFAPTDEAFAALPDGVLESLLEAENQETLARILTYHVADGTVKAEEAVELDEIPTLEGGALNVEVDREDGEITAVRVGGATVTATDIPALNGVIHVIDSVLLPPDMQ